MELKDKACLITGGTRGIGAATALEFARRGANLALVGRIMDEEAQEVRAQIETMGRACHLLSGDMAQPQDAARCVEETIVRLGGVDVLFHNAGGPALGSLLEVSPEVWYHTFDLHVHAIFHLCRAAVPNMKARGGGAILLISSAAGLRGVLNAVSYSVAKGAVIQMTRALARELANDNIRVNCVAPGVIRTRFQDYLTAEQVKNNVDNRIPLHKEGKSEDVALALAMLAENEYMTGETIVIDGGLTMRIA